MAKDKAVKNMLKFRILFVLNKIDILLFIYKNLQITTILLK